MTDASGPSPQDDDRREQAADDVSASGEGTSVPDSTGDTPLAALRAARTEFEHQVARTRADFEEANERIKQRTGRDLIVAIAIGLAIGAVLVLSLVIWKPVFLLLAAAAAILGVFELSRALSGSGRRIDLAPQLAGAAAMILSAWLLTLWMHWVAVCAAVVLVVVWRLCAVLIVRERRGAQQVGRDILAGTLVQLYVAFAASLCVLLLRQDGGQWWVLAFIIIAVAADTGAYATGLSFGRHPMAPRISPKKTWEGFGGAVLAALIAGVLLAIFMLGLVWWTGLIIGAAILVTATLGDLGESMIKRDLGIKDMSSWLPGHGGVLDRLDSILPSAAAALALYYLLTPLVAP
ncbi:phosphatidate cytidylyltransferase [Microbacterium terrisoli]|uniref:phosphatidate cytidylyltransferase n=1 Tax=Microbacterium terrisoli TaxID=3242192 RepID=UPI0028048146|nr:phosphatidate cytidylyltransferase [Microbacterium protaetiae]